MLGGSAHREELPLAADILPPTLDRVLKANSCSGCGACAGIDPAVDLRRDAKGWWRPAAVGVPKPETDGLMAAACPGARVAPWLPAAEGTAVHPIWGPHRRVMTGHATDAAVRHAGSSGGALSAIAIHLLATGAVSRVLHAGMDPAAPLLTAIRVSRDAAQVVDAAGSRYAPVAPLAGLMAELETPGPILFIGKPCDTGALRQLMAADPAIAARFPLLLSFFCAGTPSQDGTDRLVQALGMTPAEVTAFRYRGDGWPGRAAATDMSGQTQSMSYADSWGAVLSKEIQWRCKICPDGVGGTADIAAADAWDCDESGYPLFTEADGRSLIMARTAVGERVIAEAVAAGVLATEPLPIDAIDAMQPHQARRKRLVRSRLAAMAVTGLPRPDVSGLCVDEAARREGLLKEAKSLAGSVRRIRTGRW